MPTQGVRLVPGVNTVKTPALNEAGVASSSMIRFREGLIEKQKGWQKFYGFPVQGVPRAIWPWQDLEGVSHVAVGATQSLTVVTNGVAANITPLQNTTDTTSNVATTSGSSVVTITDPANGSTVFDTVDFRTPVSAGGLVLFGLYPVTPTGANTFTVTATSAATSTSSAAPVVPSFATTSGQYSVVVTLPNHGKTAGSTIAFPLATIVGGLTIQGFYTVASVADANTLTINAPILASSTATVSMNGAKAHLVYWIVTFPQAAPLGFGLGGFGLGGFGTSQTPSVRVASPITATNWTLANFGEYLIACPANGPVFSWMPSGGVGTAGINASAPPYNAGVLVADQQQMVVAWGSSVLGEQDPLLICWSDAGNPNQWQATVTDQAGSYRLPTGSKIVAAASVAGQILVWTDVDLWSMQYIGYPNVWGFNKIASGCGLIGQHAYVKLSNGVLWMSQNQFWAYQGGLVQPVDCAVFDDVFGALDTSNADKIAGAPNSTLNEAMWFYPVQGGTGENSAYVRFSSGLWDLGTLSRSAWVDQSIVGPPLGADAGGFVYQHETTFDADGAALVWSLTTGAFMLDEGQSFNYVDLLQPDVKWISPGTMLITILVMNESPDAARSFGPYSITNATRYINLNLRGRLIALQFSGSDVGSFWRMGNMRFRFQPNGRR